LCFFSCYESCCLRGFQGITSKDYRIFLYYAFAWIGGTLGGTLFDIKWFYHCVAKDYWNEDRQWWRYFVPHISGALAFAFLVLISSGILTIFNLEPGNESLTVPIAVGFIVGYFSDTATAKLKEVAENFVWYYP